MHQVIKNAVNYDNALSKYEAEIYIKGRSEILKHNFLMRFAHHLFPVNRKNNDMIFEMVTRSEYNAPNSFSHDFKAINGNSIPSSAKQQEALNFLNLNVYASTAFDDEILMPVAKSAFKVYKFSLEEIQDSLGLKIYKIRFVPKIWNRKLICGNLYIIDKIWSIDRVELNGQLSFAEFSLDMTFGRNFRRFLLPEKADLFLRYHVLGNVLVNTYHSSYKYNQVEWVEEDINKRRRKSMDLTQYFRLSSDTVPIISDSSFWNAHRDIPLTTNEEELYGKEKIISETDTSNITKYIKLTEKLTNTINISTQTTRIKYSGILNPFQLGYSKRNGITYRQKIRISKTFDKDRQFRFHPEVGFVFNKKEIFFKIGGDWEYLPEKLGILSLTAGNGNHTYSSEVTNKINELLKDSTFTFDDLNLKYYNDYYIDLRNNIELFNGFQLSAGLSYHRRIPVKQGPEKDVDEEVDDMINEQYNDFTPVIGLTYTPKQYYRMDGHRKEYVFSRYPTISIEYARGIPGVWKSVGDYERIEADIHQSIPLGQLRRLNYHISGGMFSKQKSMYFADFRYFARRYFPESWDDHIGGVFNLLKGEWYNASNSYLQAHFMYESPFILIQLLKKEAFKYVISERFYVSQLYTPALPSYTEVGYGFGTSIFNVAVFASFKKWEYQSFGFKFVFELFQ